MSLFGGGSERLAFLLDLDASGAIKGFQQVGKAAEKELGKADDRLNRIGGRMQVAGAGMVAFAGVAGRVLYGFAQAADEAEQQQRKLDNTLANAPQLADANKQAFLDLADALQDTTTAEGDAVVGIMALQGQFGLTQQQIEQLTPLIIDLSSKMGVDLETAAKAALRSTDGTATALRKMGIDVAETATDAEAFDATIEALANSVGGFAEQEAQTFSGQITILKNNLGDLAEGVGVGVLDAFNSVVGPIGSFADRLAETNPETQAMVGHVATIGTAAIGGVGALSFLSGSVLKMKDRFTDATGALNNFGRAAQFAGVAAAAAVVAAQINSIDDEANRMAADLGRGAREALNAKSSWEEFSQGVQNVGAGIQDLSDTISGSQAPWDLDKRHQMRMGRDELEAVQAEYRGVQEEIRALAAEQNISLDVATRRVLASREETEATEQLAEVVGEETAEVLTNTEATEGSTDAHQTATEAVAEHETAVEDLTSAMSDYIEEALGSTDAVANWEGALDDLTASLGEHGATLDLDTEAGRANYQAGRDVADGLVQLMQRRFEETGSIAGAIDAGNLYVEQLRDQLREAGLTRRQVQEYIDTLHLTPTDIATNFTANTAEAVRQIQELQRLALGIAAGSHEIDFHTTVKGARAAGGPVQANAAYVVGEDGPELFVPGSSGAIIPNGGGGSPSSIGGGFTLNAVINLSGGATRGDGDRIMDEIESWVKRNGPARWMS